MSADINNCFSKVERALKKLSVVIVDDYDEFRRGSPGPIVALMRKLMFSTSTVVMKQLLLRGCASHVSDKKVVIAAFDLLRDTVKHSPAISIDQFFATGFANHKLIALAKLAEYIVETDRNVVYSPNKTKFVVPNEVLAQINGRVRAESEDVLAGFRQSARIGQDDEDARSSPGRRSLSVSKRGRSMSYATINPVRDIEEVLLVDSAISPHAFHMPTEGELTLGKSITMSSGRAKSPGGTRPPSAARARTDTPTTMGSALGTPLHLREEGSPAMPSPPFRRPISPAPIYAPPQSSTANRVAAHAQGSTDGLSQEQLLQMEGLIDQRVKLALREVSEKHEFIINKLVAAVDAEFTLMANRIKVLESALKDRDMLPS